MKNIEATKFQKKCLTLIDDLDADGLIITKCGKPLARILPFTGPHSDLIGSLHHKVTIKGDVFTTGVSWNANLQP